MKTSVKSKQGFPEVLFVWFGVSHCFYQKKWNLIHEVSLPTHREYFHECRQSDRVGNSTNFKGWKQKMQRLTLSFVGRTCLWSHALWAVKNATSGCVQYTSKSCRKNKTLLAAACAGLFFMFVFFFLVATVPKLSSMSMKERFFIWLGWC